MKANSFKIKEIKIKSSKPSSVKIVSDKEVAAEVVRLNPDKNSICLLYTSPSPRDRG